MSIRQDVVSSKFLFVEIGLDKMLCFTYLMLITKET